MKFKHFHQCLNSKILHFIQTWANITLKLWLIRSIMLGFFVFSGAKKINYFEGQGYQQPWKYLSRFKIKKQYCIWPLYKCKVVIKRCGFACGITIYLSSITEINLCCLYPHFIKEAISNKSAIKKTTLFPHRMSAEKLQAP